MDRIYAQVAATIVFQRYIYVWQTGWMPQWKDYQERSAALFRQLGFTAKTDVTVAGARASHDVDVLVTYTHAGMDLMWIVECKAWKSRVKKEKVLALRGVVEDIGADKGVLLAEGGFQKGAIQAAAKSNVITSSLVELRAQAHDWLIERRLMALPVRIGRASARYWDIPKSYREESGLRPDGPFAGGYSGSSILNLLPGLVANALGDVLPPRGMVGPDLPVHTREEAVDVAELLIEDLEDRLHTAELSMPEFVRCEVIRKQKNRMNREMRSDGDQVRLQQSVALLMGYSLGEARRDVVGCCPAHSSPTQRE
jgi:restriction system protein